MKTHCFYRGVVIGHEGEIILQFHDGSVYRYLTDDDAFLRGQFVNSPEKGVLFNGQIRLPGDVPFEKLEGWPAGVQADFVDARGLDA